MTMSLTFKPVRNCSFFRNGLGDDSYFVWPDKRIPYKIGEGFNETNTANILEAVASYNEIFDGCVKWVPHTDEVSPSVIR